MKKLIVLAHIALTAVFIYFDFINFKPHSADAAKYGVIVLSFLTAGLYINRALSRKDGILLAAGLFVTAVTDYFLVLADWLRIPAISSVFHSYNERFAFGMALYGVVMIIYFFRFQPAKRAVIIPFYLIIPLVLKFYLNFDILTAVCAFYAQIMLTNLTSAIIAVKNGKFPKQNAVLLLMGMIIFIFGDIAVVLTNLFMIRIMRKFIWVFYAPSQALLSFSSYKKGSRG